MDHVTHFIDKLIAWFFSFLAYTIIWGGLFLLLNYVVFDWIMPKVLNYFKVWDAFIAFIFDHRRYKGDQKKKRADAANGYFKRLRDHPGVEFANLVGVLGAAAGASNKNMIWWHGALIGLFVVGGAAWICILLSNFKRK